MAEIILNLNHQSYFVLIDLNGFSSKLVYFRALGMQATYLVSPKEYIGTDFPGSGHPVEISSVPPQKLLAQALSHVFASVPSSSLM